MGNAILQVAIRGRVQGVGYRAWVEHQARTHGLEGWVRNRRDGSVEAVLRGTQDAVDAAIAWAREGPALAQVLEVRTRPGTESENTDGNFEVRPTA
jgi:acylphosphatase